MVTTKVFRNTSDQPLNVLGVGEIEAGSQVSVTAEYHAPVVLENYPGLEDVTDEITPLEESHEEPVENL